MTFLELVQQFAREVGATVPSSVVSQTGNSLKLVERVAKADVEIQKKWADWKFMRASVNGTALSQAVSAGTATYTAPSDVKRWDKGSFFLDKTTDSYVHLTWLDWLYFDRYLNVGTQEQDTPSNIIIKPNLDLVLYNTPDAAYTLTGDYWMKPIEMTLDADTSVIPSEHERIIIVQAKIFHGVQTDAPEVYEDANFEFNDLLDALESDQREGQGHRRSDQDGADIVVIAE